MGLQRDLLCFSHLRWNFVFQRPQHLMVRFARTRRVFYVEEPILDAASPRLDVSFSHGVHVAVPHLPPSTDARATERAYRDAIDSLVTSRAIESPLLWFYTPRALPLVTGIRADGVVYDCMDELSAFANAPADLPLREAELLERADLVFTGGQSLYEAKRSLHARVYAFPSSVDVDHFARAREIGEQPEDQRTIPAPRIGYCGVIDERMDLELLRGAAARRPDWQFVMIGPVVKIDPASLPRAANIHYLGMKRYEQLPAYMSGWQAAMLPFARNEATRFISPTKTPEYLSAGLPVVSTSVRDVVRPYGERDLVKIADTADEFVAAVEAAWAPDRGDWRKDADAMLATMSWDRTWSAMNELIEAHATRRRQVRTVAAVDAATRTPASSPASA